MLNQLLASQVDHSLVRKLKVYTAPAFSSVTNWAISPSTSRLPTSSTRSSPPAMPNAQHGHHHEHCVLRMGQYPLQHHHRHGHRRPVGGKLGDFSAGGESLRKARKTRPPTPDRFFSGAALCDSPDRRSPAGEPLNGAADEAGALRALPRSTPILHVQLQRQSPHLALAEGIPFLCGLAARPFHSPGLSAA